MSCRVTQFIYFLIDCRVFFNIGIGSWQIGFRLVIVIIADKIFHSVIRKQAFEFFIQLRSQRFVMGDNERWALNALDNIGNRKGFTRSGDTQKHLMILTRIQALS